MYISKRITIIDRSERAKNNQSDSSSAYIVLRNIMQLGKSLIVKNPPRENELLCQARVLTRKSSIAPDKSNRFPNLYFIGNFLCYKAVYLNEGNKF